MLPSLRILIAVPKVLEPGQAQESMTKSPGRASKASTQICEARSCTNTCPSASCKEPEGTKSATVSAVGSTLDSRTR